MEEEESSVPIATIAKLGELEWLIGDWVDQDDDASVETTFRWTKDYAFINGTFRVTVGDRVDLEGTQVIGWDPCGKKDSLLDIRYQSRFWGRRMVQGGQ